MAITIGAMDIMAYGSMPYVGMALKKKIAAKNDTNDTLEIFALDWSKAAMSHIRHY